MFKRLQTDFQLSIVLLYGFFSAAIITPFAIYRFLTGATAVGILDTVLVTVIACVVVYGWKYGETERTGKFLVVIGSLGALLSSEMLGVIGVFWMYVAIVANFFLTTNIRFATVFTTAVIILLAITGKSFDNAALMWSFLATSGLLAVLSYIVAHQYERQRANLEHLADTDPLTGAFNRRVMERELHLAVEEHARKGTPMSLILMDIDHFKAVNDRFGHEKGDVVLSSFAGLIKRNTRQNDRFFRFGGEEFLMLVHNGQPDEAEAIAEKIRHATEQCMDAGLQDVTVSLGVASLERGESCEQWVSRADAAMYRAKQMGRNRVES
ncbi:MAG: GGDEF domain-containing protein [Arenimonas sp.]|nr:GGDEF domain-containing protein [Arenimonas sp.]